MHESWKEQSTDCLILDIKWWQVCNDHAEI